MGHRLQLVKLSPSVSTDGHVLREQLHPFDVPALPCSTGAWLWTGAADGGGEWQLKVIPALQSDVPILECPIALPCLVP